MKLNARLLAALAAAVLLPSLLSCHNGNGTSSGGGGGSGASPNLRVVNLALDAPYNFDVLDGSTTIATDLKYDQATAFAAVSSGGLSIKFEPTGTTTTAFTASPTVGNGDNYSVIALEGTSALTAISVAQVNDTPASGQAQLSFVNAAPGVNGMDFFITAPTAVLPASASVAGVTYVGDAGSVAPTPISLASGTYRIRAVATGDATATVVYDSGPITFEAGATPLLVMTPVTGSAAAFALVSIGADSTLTTIPDQRVQVRVGNFAPADGTVDVYLDQGGAANSSTTLFQSNIAADGASTYASVLPGAYRASFTVSGQLTELVGSNVSLAAGTSVSIFAAGLPGLASPYDLQVLAFQDNLQAPPTGMANLRVVDLAPDIGSAVDLVTLTTVNGVTTVGQRIVINLAYAGASRYVPLVAGSYVVAIVPTGTTTPILPASAGTTLVLAAGSINTLVVAGCEYPGTASCPGASAPLQFWPQSD